MSKLKKEDLDNALKGLLEIAPEMNGCKIELADARLGRKAAIVRVGLSGEIYPQTEFLPFAELNQYMRGYWKAKNTVEPTYYIFGGAASASYKDTGGIFDLLKKAYYYDVFKYDPHKTPINNLLLAANGIGGFAEITDYEYLKLKQIKEAINNDTN